MAFTTTLISGNESETAVFAVCYSEDLTVTFRFRHDLGSPTSTSSRIVTCFHETKVGDNKESYQDRRLMRDAIRSSVSCVWQDCSLHPTIRFPDVIVQIQQDSQGRDCWSICHESVFQQYLDSLRSIEEVQHSAIQRSNFNCNWISFHLIRFRNVLGGRGGVTVAYLNKESSSEIYVYKGLSFRLFLESLTAFKNEQAAFYHELFLIFKLPSHSNVLKPPSLLVTTESVQADQISSTRFVCGALYPYLEKSSLQDVIEKANMDNIRLPIGSKARWAFQISSAMETVHSSQQYHMDLKPANILIDDQQNAILIDWEQSGASPFFLAPEANGAFDAELVSFDSIDEPRKATLLRYKEYTGPKSDNNWSWPARDVFRIWMSDCPQALEAAEVFSLGRTLAAIFEQIDEASFNVSRNDFRFRPVQWTAKSDDIPKSWKAFAADCTCADPNRRGTFSSSTAFWRSVLETLGETLE